MGGVLWLTSPGSSSLATLFARIFHSLHQIRRKSRLLFSVSCKSFACHSYENCRVWVYTNNSHSGTQRSFHPEQGRGSDDFPRVTNHESQVTRLSPHFRTQYNSFLAHPGGIPPWPPLRKQFTFPSSPTSHSSTFPSPKTASAWKTP